MKSGLKYKLGYASGDIYGGAAFLVFSMLYMNFLILVEGISPVAASAIIFIGKIWDAVTDPIVGNISDRTRSRFGRRRIYFLIGIGPVFLSFIMLFYSFGIENMTAKIIYHCFAYMFFGTAFTIVMVPYNAILSDMTADYNERTDYTTARMLMSAGASLVAAVVPSMIIKTVGGPVNGPAQKTGYLVMALVLAAVFASCWVATFFGTFEKKDYSACTRMTIREWLSVFRNRSYRFFLGFFLSFQIAVDLMLALFIFYIDLVVLKYQSYELVMGTLLVLSLVFMVFQGMLARKWGKVFPLFIGMPVWILASVIFLFIDSSTPVFVLCLMAALVAVGSSAGNLSTWSTLIDIYDVDEIMTGTRREGIYSGFTTFIRKSASGVAVFVLGIGLKGLGFDQNQYNLLKASSVNFDPSIYAGAQLVQGIKWLFVIIPVVLLSLTLYFAARYKLNNRRFDTLHKGIALFKSKGSIDSLDAAEIADIELVTGIKKSELWTRC
ncbi:MAG TPA: MFS transporter [Bacillota bacterium]|nr:MFS transporter [Bacillota bacterium]